MRQTDEQRGDGEASGAGTGEGQAERETAPAVEPGCQGECDRRCGRTCPTGRHHRITEVKLPGCVHTAHADGACPHNYDATREQHPRAQHVEHPMHTCEQHCAYQII